ncbi:transglutaminase N-terminal domain-containing protein, partial [uncultured Pseudomonas sp.]
MRLAIHHETLYRYADQVRASIQYLRLTPQDDARQRILGWELALPRPARAQRDPFGNILHVLTLDTPHDAITITASGQVEIDETFEAEPCQASAFPFLRQTRLTEADEALTAFAREVCDGRRDRDTLIQLMERLHERMTYVPGSTEVDG